MLYADVVRVVLRVDVIKTWENLAGAFLETTVPNQMRWG